MPHALLLKYPGTNCDVETERALCAAGFSTQVQPIATATPSHVEKAQLIVFSGGFSYGDYVMSGRLAQLETERFLGDALMKRHANGGFLFGICNGFQILTKLGILPRASLIWNKSERFECMWDRLVKVSSTCPFTQYLPQEFELPSAHAEGRLVCEPGDAQKYLDNGCVALQYALPGFRIPPAEPWDLCRTPSASCVHATTTTRIGTAIRTGAGAIIFSREPSTR